MLEMIILAAGFQTRSTGVKSVEDVRRIMQQMPSPDLLHSEPVPDWISRDWFFPKEKELQNSRQAISITKKLAKVSRMLIRNTAVAVDTELEILIHDKANIGKLWWFKKKALLRDEWFKLHVLHCFQYEVPPGYFNPWDFSSEVIYDPRRANYGKYHSNVSATYDFDSISKVYKLRENARKKANCSTGEPNPRCRWPE